MLAPVHDDKVYGHGGRLQPALSRVQEEAAAADGTFLEGTHLPIAKFFGLMYFWAHETSIKHAVEFTTVSQNTAVQ